MWRESETSRSVAWLLEEIRKEHNVDVSRDFAALERVRAAAKTADDEFQSGAATATINLPFITATASGPKHFSRSVSCEEWNEAQRAARQPDAQAVVASDSLERLAAPPRRVPISLTIVNVLNWSTMIGLLVFGFGSVQAARADYSFITFRGPHGTAVGQVTAIETMKGSEEGEDGQSATVIYANYYSLSVAGRDYFGVSYSNDARVARGDKVTIEFDENDPSRSRISGMRRGISDWSSPQFIVIAILLLIGLSTIAVGLRMGRRRTDLLRAGVLAMGNLIATRRTDPHLEDPDYELTFEFTAHDGRREAKVRISDIRGIYQRVLLSPERPVPLLLDPGNPSRAYVLEAQPARPRIDEHGHLRGRVFAVVARLVQAAVILAAAWYVAATS